MNSSSKASANIPFMDYKYFYNDHGNQLVDIMQDVLARGEFILGSDLKSFENNFAHYLGSKFAIGVGNCTDALTLILRALNLKPGSEIIVSAHTFIATAEAIVNVGCKPIAVECGVDHLIDPDAIKRAVTEKTVAIMPTQLNGRTCAMTAIKQIAEQHNLLIVEDAAQGLGSTYKGQKAGTFGIAAAFSFYPAKLLPCLGDGGIIVTDDETLSKKIMALRNHGRDDISDVGCWALNSRLDNLQAAILNYFLADFPTAISRRREIAQQYTDNLNDITNLLLPPAPNSDANHFDVYQNFEIQTPHRDALQECLSQKGIGAIKQWGGKAIHQFPALDFTVTLPFTEKVMRESLLLPLNLAVTNTQIERICQVIREFFSQLS